MIKNLYDSAEFAMGHMLFLLEDKQKIRLKTSKLRVSVNAKQRNSQPVTPPLSRNSTTPRPVSASRYLRTISEI